MASWVSPLRISSRKRSGAMPMRAATWAVRKRGGALGRRLVHRRDATLRVVERAARRAAAVAAALGEDRRRRRRRRALRVGRRADADVERGARARAGSALSAWGWCTRWRTPRGTGAAVGAERALRRREVAAVQGRAAAPASAPPGAACMARRAGWRGWGWRGAMAGRAAGRRWRGWRAQGVEAESRLRRGRARSSRIGSMRKTSLVGKACAGTSRRAAGHATGMVGSSIRW